MYSTLQRVLGTCIVTPRPAAIALRHHRVCTNLCQNHLSHRLSRNGEERPSIASKNIFTTTTKAYHTVAQSFSTHECSRKQQPFVHRRALSSTGGTSPLRRRVHVYNVPGLVEYDTAWDWQKRFHKARMANDCDAPDVLLLLQHPPVYTLGRGSSMKNILFDYDPDSQDECEFQVRRVERGGQVTYHGPGQLVGYSILNLRRDPFRKDLHWYLRQIEEVVITALAQCGISNAARLDKFTGVWVDDAKLAAIGLSVSKWVTMHGFAMNVNPDLQAFDRIVPCGISVINDNKTVSSLAHQAPGLWTAREEGGGGDEEDMERVKGIVMDCFSDVFDVSLQIHNRAPNEQELQ